MLLPNRISLDKTIRWALSQRVRAFLSFIDLSKRKQLNDLWKGLGEPTRRNAVVIAGGPSYATDIQQALLDARSRFDVIAMNFYCLNDNATRLVPDYYVLSDPAHLVQDHAVVGAKNELLKKYINENDVRLCAPYGRGWGQYQEGYLMFDDTEDLFSDNIDPKYPRGYCSNTAFKSIALALALGYDKIFVVGLDYDYPKKLFLTRENKLVLSDEHHYEKKLTDFSGIFDSVGHALYWWSFDYWTLKKLSSSKVVNVTETSLVDSFDRMSPRDFIEFCKSS